MMEPKKVRPQVVAIQARFFQAIDMLIQSGRIRGLQTFCAEYGLHRPKYSTIRTHLNDVKNPGAGYKLIDIDALMYLVNDFGVSSDWLLTGAGGMYKRQINERHFQRENKVQNVVDSGLGQ